MKVHHDQLSEKQLDKDKEQNTGGEDATEQPKNRGADAYQITAHRY